MIPERAYEISSVTLKTSKTYKSSVGRFSYQHVKAPYYSYGMILQKFCVDNFIPDTNFEFNNFETFYAERKKNNNFKINKGVKSESDCIR